MFTIGADPELFFKQDSKFISVVGLIGGTKREPMDIGAGCAIQEDNVAAEFCIPACNSAADFIKSINYAVSDIQQRANKLGLSLATLTASAVFDEDQLQTQQAQEFGCDPDYNIYTGQANPRPKARNKALRSAGGHVHVGTKKDPFHVIQALDLYLGVPSVLIDKDTQRRKLYGKAGCYRPKPYGVEYRTLSNFWIWNNDTIKWVYHQVNDALEAAEDIHYNFNDEMTDEVITCINTGDKKLASKFIDIYDIIMP